MTLSNFHRGSYCTCTAAYVCGQTSPGPSLRSSGHPSSSLSHGSQSFGTEAARLGGIKGTSPWPPLCASDLPLTCKVRFYTAAEVKGSHWEDGGWMDGDSRSVGVGEKKRWRGERLGQRPKCWSLFLSRSRVGGGLVGGGGQESI